MIILLYLGWDWMWFVEYFLLLMLWIFWCWNSCGDVDIVSECIFDFFFFRGLSFMYLGFVFVWVRDDGMNDDLLNCFDGIWEKNVWIKFEFVMLFML